MKKILIRITDVRMSAKDQCHVAFYAGDSETEILWKSTPPQIGDVIETSIEEPDQNPRLIGRAMSDAWSYNSDALRWRRPLERQSISRMEILRRRHKIKQAIRAYFDAQSFIEIDAPLLVRGTTPDTALESFAVGDRYLATSTEYQMKRLAVGGFERIYSLTQNFRRDDGEGAFRNPEFTMLEWGRVGEKMDAIEQDAESFILAAMRALGLTETLTYDGHQINMRGPWQRLSVIEAIRKATGCPITEFDSASCALAAKAIGIEIRNEWLDHPDFLFSILMDTIQPRLGQEQPVFINEWPLSQTSSADKSQETNHAVRSELFIAGIELSDGFAGLADYDMQKQFFDYMLSKRQAAGQPAVALDERYMDSMKLGTPYGAGMALGFDRLVILLTDQQHIRNVLPFAWDEV